jgi:hypothetical protein
VYEVGVDSLMYHDARQQNINIDKCLVYFKQSVFPSMFWILLTMYSGSETILRIAVVIKRRLVSDHSVHEIY